MERMDDSKVNEFTSAKVEKFNQRENEILEEIIKKIDRLDASIGQRFDDLEEENKRLKNDIKNLQEQHFNDIDRLLRQAIKKKDAEEVLNIEKPQVVEEKRRIQGKEFGQIKRTAFSDTLAILNSFFKKK